MVALAETEPQNPDAHYFAACEAWRQGKYDVALRHAERGIALEPDSLALLKILAQTAADNGDDMQAYEYAKRLLNAKRIDKVAEPWLRLLLTPFRLFPTYRARSQEFFENYVPKNDEWLAWAKEYVEWYESQEQSPRPNP